MRKMYLTAEEVSAALGVSVGTAYKVIRSMNDELSKDGYLTIAGKVPAKYFGERIYGSDELMGGDENACIPRHQN
jgi:hypothetical protein